MTTAPYGCIDLGESSRPSDFGTHKDYCYGHVPGGRTVRAVVNDLGTTYLRLWAPWHVFQPENTPSYGALEVAPGVTWAQWLDAQLNAAASDGKKVILCLFGSPRWANGTATLKDTDVVEDRRSPWGNSNGWGDALKGMEYGVPTDRSASGPFAQWVTWLCDRYRATTARGRLIEVLEICNEPNGMMWPQRSPSGSAIMGSYIAEMMITAYGIATARGMRIGGPATADSAFPPAGPSPAFNNRSGTPYDVFLLSLVGSLQSMSFSAKDIVWTHHNYGDLEAVPYTSNWSNSTVGKIRDALDWLGWPTSWLFVTEGGVRDLNNDGRQVFAYDAARVLLTAHGTNVGMLTTRFIVAGPGTECGLVRTDGTNRVFYDVWKTWRINGQLR